MTTLEEARQKLEQLTQARTELETQLDHAIDAADADTAISLRKLLDENSVRQFAQKSRVIRLEKQQSELDREEALASHTELEEQFSAAARQVELAQKHLQDVWEKYQRIGVQLFALDQKMETERQNINEKQKVLVDRTIRWKQDVHLTPAHEAACDL